MVENRKKLVFKQLIIRKYARNFMDDALNVCGRIFALYLTNVSAVDRIIPMY